MLIQPARSSAFPPCFIAIATVLMHAEGRSGRKEKKKLMSTRAKDRERRRERRGRGGEME